MIQTSYYGAHKSKRALQDFIVAAVAKRFIAEGVRPTCFADFKNKTEVHTRTMIEAIARDGVSLSYAKIDPIGWSIHKVQRDAYYTAITDMIQ